MIGPDECGCYDCLDDGSNGLGNPVLQRMIICPECGNKRCPKATSHLLSCTNCNESGQPGSIFYESFPVKGFYPRCYYLEDRGQLPCQEPVVRFFFDSRNGKTFPYCSGHAARLDKHLPVLGLIRHPMREVSGEEWTVRMVIET